MAGTKAPQRKSLRTRGRPSKERQKFIEGTEPPRFKDIDEAAKAYVGVRDERMGLTDDETAAKDKLLAKMKEHGLTDYSFDGYMVNVSHVDEDVVKVKRLRAAKEDGSLA